MSKDAVFQIGERMFGGGSSQPYLLRRGRLLLALQPLFVQVTGYYPPRRHGASRFQEAGSADFRLCGVEHDTVLPHDVFAGERVPGRAPERA